MRNTRLAVLVLGAAVLIASPTARAADLVVQSQVVGLMNANCYLLYDTQRREAAIFDVAGPVDSLTQTIREKGLELKYIFITHAHCDHVFGLPELTKSFPKAKVCVSKEDYEDAALYRQWAEKLDPKQVEEIRQNPELVRLMDFDLRSIGEPAIVVKDSDVFRLGDAEIRAFLSPGHSRGSVCYQAGKMLFSGDVLFYRNVGRTDLAGSGGWDAIVKSVHRLYSSLPDDTTVYPGHGQSTDIGSEKNQNPKVSLHSTQPN
jgi:glyoxylase-like metal-dependent hydrolase (beta-lactamase superfamily II)